MPNKDTINHVHGTLAAQLVYRVQEAGYRPSIAIFTLVQVPGVKGTRVVTYKNGKRVGSARMQGEQAHRAAERQIAVGLGLDTDRESGMRNMFTPDLGLITLYGQATLVDLQYC